METVMVQSMRAEAAPNNQEHFACFLWDLANFCEHVDTDLLWERAKASGFPMIILAISLNQYRSQRFLGLGDLVFTCYFPSRGIAAGCTFATTWVQVYAMAPLRVCARNACHSCARGAKALPSSFSLLFLATCIACACLQTSA